MSEIPNSGSASPYSVAIFIFSNGIIAAMGISEKLSEKGGTTLAFISFGPQVADKPTIDTDLQKLKGEPMVRPEFTSGVINSNLVSPASEDFGGIKRFSQK